MHTPVNVSGTVREEHMPLDGVSRGVAKMPDAIIKLRQSGLVGKHGARQSRGSASRPRFAIHKNARPTVRDFVQSGAHGVHGLDVDQAHQVESEAVKMVFPRPIRHGFHHKTAEHRTFRGHIASASGAVRQRPVRLAAQEVFGHDALEPVVGREHVIVDHVHNHFDAGIMQRLHHLLDLADAHGPVIRIRGVRSFRNVVIDGIVTPVVSAADRFVDGTEIVDRHQLHRGNAKLFEIRQSRRKIRMTVQRRSQVGERKIFSTMGFGESSRGIVAEIADMRFPNNRLRNRHFRHAIGIPTFGIGARQVDDHASTAVHASRVRPWIGNAIDGTAIAFNQKIVI